jgi:hypothetical protein
MTSGRHIHAFLPRSVNGLLPPIGGRGLATPGFRQRTRSRANEAGGAAAPVIEEMPREEYSDLHHSAIIGREKP